MWWLVSLAMGLQASNKISIVPSVAIEPMAVPPCHSSHTAPVPMETQITIRIKVKGTFMEEMPIPITLILK